ncbi:DUF899 domain-containing protein [Oricola cellulosilytica]|uniref:DUF899 domain-containing protein n=1 Tax=Oricola cellulosilytica TaxID=1429082 RepID=A0A4R0PF08_9HYPH|nr:DUF899 domain-containing protein [Oricola cellulosilytica]TCD16407.1 DUF899 domain-containing protein [Oricola cellulosilytica]
MENLVSREEWIEARKSLLAREKAFTRDRDALSRARREMPMVRVDDAYAFDTETGETSLAGLFGGRRQLVVYHFMFGPDWEEGCPSCSFWADNFDGIDVHLSARDTAFCAVSNAPLEKLIEYRQRMGWSFRWVSSRDGSFSRDFAVTFPGKSDPTGRGYNYSGKVFGEEMPGLSAFLRLKDGGIGHAYSTYARGLDIINGAYNILDLTPLGRQEEGQEYTMAWLRRRDRYDG